MCWIVYIQYYAAEIVIGWESFSYTAFEGDQGSEQFCLLVENNKVLARPASLNILIDIESTTAQCKEYH